MRDGKAKSGAKPVQRMSEVALMFEALIEDILPERGASKETIARARRVSVSFQASEDAGPLEDLFKSLDAVDDEDRDAQMMSIWMLAEACLRASDEQ